MKVSSLVILALVLISVPSALAQQVDKPSIAILRFGSLPSVEITEGAILDILESYGYIIETVGEFAIGVNLDSASTQGIEIRDEVMQEAVAVIQGGRPAKLAPGVLAAIARRGVIVPMEARQEEDMAWLASLRCTPEMIAEQQAELDAAE